MSDQPKSSKSGDKPRGTTRMRFVGPPGMSVDTGAKTVGRYEILKTLGKGAMGVVYKARDPLLDRVVAVKTIMSPQGAGKRVRSAYIERFQREAKAAAKMQHPSIVTIFDVGVEAGAPFMVLEYLPGESLADRLDRVRLPLAKAIDIALDLANALAFAHRQRIVHRDVKPANVLHAGENRWKLADFGIARMPDSDLTQIGIFMGTPGYSPPEAIKQGKYTAQADVFAWGAVLYELLSGRIPYEGPDTKTTNSYVLRDTARDIREHDTSIPVPVAEVTMRALASAPEKRYKDAAEAEEALRKAWQFCLNSAMIPPSCLTAEEVPHERVGRHMHEGVNPMPPPSSLLDEGPVSSAPNLAPPKPVLVIESSKGDVSDDAPTQVLNVPSNLPAILGEDDDPLAEPPTVPDARTSKGQPHAPATASRSSASASAAPPRLLGDDPGDRRKSPKPGAPLDGKGNAKLGKKKAVGVGPESQVATDPMRPSRDAARTSALPSKHDKTRPTKRGQRTGPAIWLVLVLLLSLAGAGALFYLMPELRFWS